MARGGDRRSRAAAAALAAGTSALVLSSSPAFGAAEPGQAINNDYGQSDYEVSQEIVRQVEASATVKTALATYTTLRTRYTYWVTTAAARYRAYKAALATGSSTKIAAAKKAYLSAVYQRNLAKKKQDAARTALLSARAKAKTYYTSKHYRPVDGTYLGDVAQYFIPGIGLEPIQVRITVYGGHLSDIAVPVYTDKGSSAYYNSISLPTLMTEAMNSGDTAKVATVSTATLTSEAFIKSLTSALLKAGYKF
jgi:uncharacterized protein with FMN-binding domain